MDALRRVAAHLGKHRVGGAAPVAATVSLALPVPDGDEGGQGRQQPPEERPVRPVIPQHQCATTSKGAQWRSR